MNGDNEIDQAAAARDFGQMDTLAWTTRPERSLMDVLESKSTRLALFADQTPGFAYACILLATALSNYANRAGCSPRELIIRDMQVSPDPDGATISAKIKRVYPRRVPRPIRRYKP